MLKEAYLNILMPMQIYSEMIGNVMIDARSTGKYYHCKYWLKRDSLSCIISFVPYLFTDACNVVSHFHCSCTSYGSCCFPHYA